VDVELRLNVLKKDSRLAYFTSKNYETENRRREEVRNTLSLL